MNTRVGIFAQRREHGGRLFHTLAFDYIEATERVWGIPIIIPAHTKYLHSYLDLCDRYIFPGGSDIDPSLYGQYASGARWVMREYDRYLLDAMRDIMMRKQPILGICKGMQMMNILHSGTLIQDIAWRKKHFQPDRGYETVDEVTFATWSYLEKAYGSNTLGINSIHHQGIDRLGDGLEIVARSGYDGEIEAIEHMSLPHYGVQWHPEYLKSEQLFKWFVMKNI